MLGGGAGGGAKGAAQNWKASSPGCSGPKLGRLDEELMEVCQNVQLTK